MVLEKKFGNWLFLVVIFSIFGQEYYGAAMITQALIDTNTCLVIAALALESFGTRAPWNASQRFWR